MYPTSFAVQTVFWKAVRLSYVRAEFMGPQGHRNRVHNPECLAENAHLFSFVPIVLLSAHVKI